MTAKNEQPEELGSFGRVARWAAEPYLSFKDDRMRLYALICRDLRRIAIVAIVVYSGVNIPWLALRGWWG
jgi:hypothetical protein